MIPDFAKETALYFELSAVDGLIERSRKFAPHQVPVYEAVRDREIALGRFARNETPSFACLCNPDHGNPPMLVLIIDDGEQERGPAGWPLAGGWMQWAERVLIYDISPKVAHYAGFPYLTKTYSRFVVVECESTHADAWLDAAKRAGAHATLTPR